MRIMRTLPKFTQPLVGALLAVAAFSGSAYSQTTLTTIQDTLYKADGTRFSGTLTIQWNTFDATNVGTVVQQSKTVPVLNGNLQVQLTPNAGAPAPANTYTVLYQSDGYQQFTETWTVPVSATSLTVADVRTGTVVSSTSGSGSSSGNSAVTEASVTGLVNDLAQRPVKGPGFGAGSVAVVNQNGQIDTAVGNIGDCVFVDGSTGPCGTQSPQFFDQETPGGIVDGTNKTFTLANAPTDLTLHLYRNGIFMKENFDYTLSGSTITFATGAQPQPQDTLVASYRIDPAGNLGNIGNIGSGSNQTKPTVLAQVLCSAAGAATTSGTAASLGSCDIPANALNSGDRIEVRFAYTHTGAASGFDVTLNWGSATILARHGGTQDLALAGQADASIGAGGAQITIQSWGTVLAFLPGIVSAPAQSGLKVDLRGDVSTPGSDSLALTSFTVLRYPAN